MKTVFLALPLLALCSVAGAADLVAPDGTVVHRTKLEQACSDALTRFCPELDGAPGQTRNQIICLRPYRTSLTPYCRAAVNAGK